jgi:uncharacterized membrane protein
MQAQSVTTVINRPQDEVFAFINKIENLPKWANEFAKGGVKEDDGHHKVVTPQGELFLSYDADPKRGLIDMWAGPTEDQMGVFPVRTIPLPDGSTAVTTTLYQTPDVDEAAFARQIESLTRETGNLKRLLEG